VKPENQDKVKELQEWVNSKWELLQKKEEFSKTL